MNLASIVDGHEDGRPAIVSRGRTTDYGTLRSQIDGFRGSLIQLGVRRNDRVALVCGNSRAFVVSYLATVGLGAIAVPLNPLAPSPELQRELEVVTPTLVVLEASGMPSFSGLLTDRLPGLRHVVLTDRQSVASISGSIESHSFDEMTSGNPTPVVDVDDRQPAVLVFTSGTAGSPRAANLTHRNLLANIEQNRRMPDHVRADDVVFGVLPVFHIFGLNVVIGMTLDAGACVVLVQRFDPVTAVETIGQRGVTVVPGAPPVWVAWSMLEGFEPSHFASVRLALTGAARTPADVADRLAEKFGITLREGYGLTEASPVVTSSVGVDVRRESVGRVVPGVEVRVVDSDGSDIIAGDSGEVLVRGDNVFAGYWNDPEATARVLDDEGWLHTGDIATVDGDGYLYLLDRAKDLIIVSGFNVFPAEVEEVLMRHPAVREAGVIGVPHPQTGESVRAYVVLNEGTETDEDALIDHCHDHVARYKCPNKVLIVDSLPHNHFGKLLRRSL
ncbi:MAG: AMP-binding protein [Actinomycetota bacterium]|nr:AMP-binding protein [Actinomycetota bacterium]MDA2971381.1 AMP-binding protein [Actinomycetota bacterium]MDA3000943.1 AMP-binding protein [Actinomycetota bacterium]